MNARRELGRHGVHGYLTTRARTVTIALPAGSVRHARLGLGLHRGADRAGRVQSRSRSGPGVRPRPGRARTHRSGSARSAGPARSARSIPGPCLRPWMSSPRSGSRRPPSSTPPRDRWSSSPSPCPRRISGGVVMRGVPGHELGAVRALGLGQDAADVQLHRPLRQDQPVGDLPVGQRLGERGGDLAFPAGRRVRPSRSAASRAASRWRRSPCRACPGGPRGPERPSPGSRPRPVGAVAISQQPGQVQRRHGKVRTGADDLVARQRLTQQPDGRVPVPEDLGQLAEVTADRAHEVHGAGAQRPGPSGRTAGAAGRRFRLSPHRRTGG